MQTHRKLVILWVAVLGCLLSGCGSSAPGPDVSSGTGQDVPTHLLITTAKTLPDDFFQVADQGVLAKKVTNQAAFEDMWKKFGLQDAPPQRSWEREAVIFLGVIESGSCPYHLESLEFTAEKALRIRLQTEPNKPCTDDATPRAFVMAVDAAQAADTEWVILENFGGLTPKVQLRIYPVDNAP